MWVDFLFRYIYARVAALLAGYQVHSVHRGGQREIERQQFPGKPAPFFKLSRICNPTAVSIRTCSPIIALQMLIFVAAGNSPWNTNPIAHNFSSTLNIRFI